MQSKYSEYPAYMPVIKWQKWEKKALEKVDSALISRIAPCIEIRTSQQHTDILTSLLSVWSHKCYVDYSDPEGRLTKIVNGALVRTRLNELLIFVNTYNNSKLVIPTLSPLEFSNLNQSDLNQLKKCSELAFRLRLSSLEIDDSHIANLGSILKTAQSHQINVELIIDLRVTPTNVSTKTLNSFSRQLLLISRLGFRSVRLLSGAFPDSIASIVTGSGNFMRHDWELWKKIDNLTPNLKIGYADYGILAPTWTEKTLTRRGSKVAIKYTRDKDWLVLRAAGNKTNDSISLSVIMTTVHKADFKGKGYSYGDDLIDDRANASIPLKNKKCGHYQFTEAWSHHMAFVLKEQY
ncbi:beta family protein [Lonsdalea quercina]|uniref:beta family protein n=1 Tax=Lonsdalea quercina TaxID=71657 RepID=UPI003974A3C4